VRTLHSQTHLAADRPALPAHVAGGRAVWTATELQSCADSVMPIVRPAGNGRELVMAGWGLVPFWLKPDQLGKQPFQHHKCARRDYPNVADLSRALQETAMPGDGNRLVRVAEARRERQKEAAVHFKPKAEPSAPAGV
jgi:hypothetical protein